MRISAFLKLLRPAQAYKAGLVFLPALFHGHRSLNQHWRGLVGAMLVWLLASSLVYVFNDIFDAPKDRQREDRKNRPIASGEVTKGQASVLGALLAVSLVFLLVSQPPAMAAFVGAYLTLNLCYSLGLKSLLGVQQAIVAIGFWLRLKSGGMPVVDIPITPWAALFTLGLAYYLNCLKGMAHRGEEHHRPDRFAMGVGAGLAGSLALAALVAICLKRGIEGSMRWPELPPLFCLIGMHRVAREAFRPSGMKEQAMTFFADPVTLLSMGAFALLFIAG